MSTLPTLVDSKKHFDDILKSSTIVVVDFFAVWCSPCQKIGPLYDKLSNALSRPNRVTFAKVDVDNTQDIAREYNVLSLPTFLIFRDGKVKDKVDGADSIRLQAVVEMLASEVEMMGRGGERSVHGRLGESSSTSAGTSTGGVGVGVGTDVDSRRSGDGGLGLGAGAGDGGVRVGGSSGGVRLGSGGGLGLGGLGLGGDGGGGPSTSSFWKGADIPRGYSDVTGQVELAGSEVLNADEDAGSVKVLLAGTKPSALADGGGGATKDWVQSGADDQLLLFLPLQSTIKLHTLQLTSLPAADQDQVSRPQEIRLFINRPQNMDFSEADDTEPTQTIQLSAKDWNAEGTASVGLRFVKFQRTTTLIVYVQKGNEGAESVRLDRIRLIGEAGAKREMGKLQKVGADEG